MLAVAGLAVAAAVVPRKLRNAKFYLRCGAEHITAAEGGLLGQSQLGGPIWEPIPISPFAECQNQTFSTREELTAAFRSALVAQVESWLTTKRPKDDERERIDEVQKQIEQALLLSRSPESRSIRAQLDRLLGDIEYWRAQDEIDAARERLRVARDHLQEAQGHRPRHARDTAAWGALVDRVEGELSGDQTRSATAATPRSEARGPGLRLGPGIAPRNPGAAPAAGSAAPAPVGTATGATAGTPGGAAAGPPGSAATDRNATGRPPPAVPGQAATDAGAPANAPKSAPANAPKSAPAAGQGTSRPPTGTPATPGTPPQRGKPPPDAGVPAGGSLI